MSLGSRGGATCSRPPAWEEAPEFGRRETLLRALRRLWELKPGPACIVETGTIRNDSPRGRDGDGWSTVALGWYCSRVGGRAYTVDSDAGALEVCRRVTAPFAASIEYVQSDSVELLSTWPYGEIDLLYLDSFDYIDHEGSEEHNLREAEAALPRLAPAALLLIDDMHPCGEPDVEGVPPFSGKGARTVPFLRERGFAVEWYEGGQVLLARGPGAGGVRQGSERPAREEVRHAAR